MYIKFVKTFWYLFGLKSKFFDYLKMDIYMSIINIAVIYNVRGSVNLRHITTGVAENK